ncbi:MAG: shikimate kinase [Syntrophomonadaceae bacterium]
MKNIVLIGFMATGKTSVGAVLAQKLGKMFVDMDHEIEKLVGMSIAEIFKKYGEERFRLEETLMAKKVGQLKSSVIATGGGTVTNMENVAYLKNNGKIICLDADPRDIEVRVNRKKGTRPMLAREGLIEDIEKLLQKREPFYAHAADIRIDTRGKNIEMVATEIVQLLSKQHSVATII